MLFRLNVITTTAPGTRNLLDLKTGLRFAFFLLDAAAAIDLDVMPPGDAAASVTAATSDGIPINVCQCLVHARGAGCTTAWASVWPAVSRQSKQ